MMSRNHSRWPVVALVLLAASVGGDASSGGPRGDVLFIDADFACGGDGSDATPFCSLQEAFDAAAVVPGVRLQVRDASQAYAGGTAGPGASGSAGEPIVLEPAPGHHPTIGGQVEIDGAAYWHVAGLRFEPLAGGGPYAIYARARSKSVLQGIEITNNRIIGWGGDNSLAGGSAIRISSPTDGADVFEPRIHGNLVVRARSEGISVTGASGATVTGNIVRQHRCGADFRAIFVERSDNARISRNQVLDFDFDECPTETPTARIMGILALDLDGGRVDHNLVRGIARADGQGASADSVQGIGFVNGCEDTDVDHNIIVDTEDCGLCVGIDYSGSGSNMRFAANTVLAGGVYGIELDMFASQISIESNVIADASVVQVRVRSADQLASVGNNLYWNAGDPRVGQCGGGATIQDLEGWQDDCDVDAASAFGDPMLPAQAVRSDEFTPPTTSSAIDLGRTVAGLVDAFHGRAPDVGALEAPRPVEALIEEALPTRIRLEIENGAGGALLYENDCTGFSVEVDGVPRSLLECTRGSGELIELDLEEPVYADEVVTVEYDGTHITDAAAVGGIIGAQLQPFTLDVENGATEPAPEDETESSSTGEGPDPSSGDEAGTTSVTTDGSTETGLGSSGVSSETSGTEADSDTDPGNGATASSGCACRAHEDPDPSWLMLVVFAGLLGRRRRSPAS